MNIPDAIDGARRAFEIAGRGCLVRIGEDEPRYATVAEIAARLEPHPDATMLLTAVSEAVERYDPAREAAILLEVPSGYQVLILSPEGYDYVGGLTFEGYGSEGLSGISPAAGDAPPGVASTRDPGLPSRTSLCLACSSS